MVDEVVAEPLGGAHLDPAATAASLKQALHKHLQRQLDAFPTDRLLDLRYKRYRRFGVYEEAGVVKS